MSNEYTTDLNGPASGMQSPGELLKTAREQKQLTQPEVAQQLRLRVQWIIDIENNHFTDASALIYVRGYLRSYAKLVNLDPEMVLAAFDRLKFDEPFLQRKPQPTLEDAIPASSTVLPFYKTKFRRNINTRKLSLIGGIAAGSLAMVLALFWWRGEHAAHAAITDSMEASVSVPTTTDTKTETVNHAADGTELTLPKAEAAAPVALPQAPVTAAPMPPLAHPVLKNKKADEQLPPVEELDGTDVTPVKDQAHGANDLSQLPDKISR